MIRAFWRNYHAFVTLCGSWGMYFSCDCFLILSTSLLTLHSRSNCVHPIHNRFKEIHDVNFRFRVFLIHTFIMSQKFMQSIRIYIYICVITRLQGIEFIMCHTHTYHDDVIKWKHLPRYWPFVRGIHRSPVNSSHKGQLRGALMFSLICVWIDGWVNNREAGGLDAIALIMTTL